MMMRLQIRKIVLLLVFSCFLTTPLLASDPVTVVIEEITIEQKTKLFVYGYAEGVDRWQEVRITLSDRDSKTSGTEALRPIKSAIGALKRLTSAPSVTARSSLQQCLKMTREKYWPKPLLRLSWILVLVLLSS